MRRGLCASSKLLEYCARPPRKQEPSWRTLASKLKESETSSDDSAGKEYIDKKLKPFYDVSDSIAKLEDELQEEMAVALGKTGDKTVYYYKLHERAHAQYLRLSDENNRASLEERLKACRTFNALRTEAENARRNLIIHRQAIGFYWRNHHIVEEKFPLIPKVVEPTN